MQQAVRYRETYLRDGVVHLKGAFSIEWLDLLSSGIQHSRNQPGPRYEERSSGDKLVQCSG